MRDGELTGRRLQTFSFSNPLQIVQLLLRHLRFGARLGEGNIGAIEIASRECAFPEQFLDGFCYLLRSTNAALAAAASSSAFCICCGRLAPVVVE